jgi:hypothetical protein
VPVDKQGSNRYMFHVNMTHLPRFSSLVHCCSRVRIDKPANESRKICPSFSSVWYRICLRHTCLNQTHLYQACLIQIWLYQDALFQARLFQICVHQVCRYQTRPVFFRPPCTRPVCTRRVCKKPIRTKLCVPDPSVTDLSELDRSVPTRL